MTVVAADGSTADFVRPVRSTTSRNVGLGLAGLVFVAGFFVPRLLDDPFKAGLAVDGLLLAIVALAIGFLIHASGMVSLGHAGFFGASAYVVAISTTRWDWHPLVAVIAAVTLTTLFALAIGALVVRVPGISFAVITLAVGQALYVLVLGAKLRPLTNGFDGLPVRYSGSILGWGPGQLGNAETFWPVPWIALSALAFIVWLIRQSRWGKLLEAIRENEERARFCGISTFLPRLLAFVFSGFAASVGGALFALHDSFVSPTNLHWSSSANALVAAIVGGVGVVAGPIVGAILYVFGRAEFAASGQMQLYTGIALVVVLTLAPSGLSGIVVWLVDRAKAVGRSNR